MNSRNPEKIYPWLLAVCTILSLVIIEILGKKLMTTNNDGFWIETMYVLTHSPVDWEPLNYVHAVRWFAVSPLWFAEFSPMASLLQGMLVIAAAVPLLFVKSVGWRKLFLCVIPLIPVILSFRSALAAYGIGYLYLQVTGEQKSKLLFLISALFANLSSGVVLFWIAIVVFFRGTLRHQGAVFFILLVVMLAGLTTSIQNKLVFFSSKAAIVTSQRSEAENISNSTDDENINPIGSMVSRNTIYVACVTGQYSRLAFHSFILLLFAGVLIYCGMNLERYKVPFIFFICVLPLFLVEGLGTLAPIVSLILFLGVTSAQDSNSL